MIWWCDKNQNRKASQPTKMYDRIEVIMMYDNIMISTVESLWVDFMCCYALCSSLLLSFVQGIWQTYNTFYNIHYALDIDASILRMDDTRFHSNPKSSLKSQVKTQTKSNQIKMNWIDVQYCIVSSFRNSRRMYNHTGISYLICTQRKWKWKWKRYGVLYVPLLNTIQWLRI